MLESHLLNKLNSIDPTFQELTSKLEGREILTQPELQQIFRDIVAIEETVNTFHLWQKLNHDLIATERLLQESVNDRELQALVNLEVAELNRQIADLEYRLRMLLLQKNPHDDRNVLLEITAGSGGDEAGIWVEDLMRMYVRYAETQWKVKIINESSASIGCYEILLEIEGDRAYSQLKFESGVHEIEHRSTIEQKNKVITATATVHVMPVVDRDAVEIPEEDLEIYIHDRMYCGGPRPKPHNSITLYHKPTGMRVFCCEERNQKLNIERALHIVETKLYSIELKRQQEYLNQLQQDRVYLNTDLLPLMTNDSRTIRSYSYIHDRVIDRRLAGRFELNKVLSGDLGEIIQGCLDRDLQERLSRSSDRADS